VAAEKIPRPLHKRILVPQSHAGNLTRKFCFDEAGKYPAKPGLFQRAVRREAEFPADGGIGLVAGGPDRVRRVLNLAAAVAENRTRTGRFSSKRKLHAACTTEK
jgi:hypothetical protein